MTFSILIPVYNVERYLPQCLDSVLMQDYDDYEVILVNDGSTDGSSQICENYAKKDERIKYYSKSNEGLLLTRRYSLQYAKGDYILFLDSDDYWEQGLLSTIHREIENADSIDMILYRYKRIRDKGQVLYEDNGLFPDHTIFTSLNKDVFLEKFVSSSRLNTMWSKCVRRNVVDINADYSQFRDKKGEDLLQSITLIQNAHIILYIDKALYNYRLSPSGRGRNFKIKYLYDFEDVRHHVYEKLQNMNVGRNVMQHFFESYIMYLNKYIPSIINSSASYSNFIIILHDIRSFKLYNIIKEQYKEKTTNRIINKFVMQMESNSWRFKYYYYKNIMKLKKLRKRKNV